MTNQDTGTCLYNRDSSYQTKTPDDDITRHFLKIHLCHRHNFIYVSVIRAGVITRLARLQYACSVVQKGRVLSSTERRANDGYKFKHTYYC